MRWLVRCLLASALAVASAGPAASQIRQAHEEDRAWIPVSGTDGDLLIIPVIINGKPAKAMVDSGVAGVMLNKAFAERERMPLTKIGTAQDLGGGQSRYITPHFQLTVDGIVGPDAPVQVSDVTRLEQASGSQIDAVIGASFIAAYGLELDFDNHRLRFEAPAIIQSSQFGVPLYYDGTELNVSANVGGKIVSPLYLDLGSNSGVRLTGIQARDIIGNRPVTDVKSVGAGGNEVTELVTLPTFTVGEANFGAVEVQLALGGDSDRPAMAGSLGLGVLQRYNLGIDVHHSMMFLTPRIKPMAGTQKSTIGLQFAHKSDRMIITHVMKNSPAEKAGFSEHEAICSVNGEVVDKEWHNRPISRWSTSNLGVKYDVRLCSGEIVEVESANFY